LTALKAFLNNSGTAQN